MKRRLAFLALALTLTAFSNVQAQQTRETIVFPSTAEFQRSGDVDVPAAWAIAYLQQMVGKLPADQRATAIVRNWKGMQLVYTRVVSAQELQNERAAQAWQLLQGAGTRALTADEVTRLRQLLEPR